MVPRRAVANICKSLDQRQSAEDTQSVQTGDNAGETNETNETDWSSVHALRYPQSKYRGDVIKEAEVVQAELDGEEIIALLVHHSKAFAEYVWMP